MLFYIDKLAAQVILHSPVIMKRIETKALASNNKHEWTLRTKKYHKHENEKIERKK